MPKTCQHESVLQNWVCLLPFMQQALLLLAMRGPDGLGKHANVKPIVRFLRGAIIKPAGDLDYGQDEYGDFMAVNYNHWQHDTRRFFDDWDNLNVHFILHLIHAAEVIGYKHSDVRMRHDWNWFYVTSCKCFHMNAETEEQLDKRLNL